MCVYLSAVSVWDFKKGPKYLVFLAPKREKFGNDGTFFLLSLCVYVNGTTLLRLYIECKLSTLSC